MTRISGFQSKKWGVFFHYLERSMNERTNPLSLGRSTTWDECIRDFDCDAFAAKLHELGAGYVILTVMQCTRHLLAPNQTYDAITGYKPGEACAKTDFIEKIYEALAKYDIDLLLYFTGDGPCEDLKACAAFGGIWHGQRVTAEYVEKWASVAREYSLRYGKKIKGWWIDGCFNFIDYDEEKLKLLYDAVRAGNPDALVGVNYYGCLDSRARIYYEVQPPQFGDDFTAGEVVTLGDLPLADGSKFGDCCWHIASPMGVSGNYEIHSGWSSPGSRYSGEFLKNYIQTVNDRGGVVSLGLCIYRDGHIDPEQCEVLSHLNN